nr:unnamed protein product [Digitaria exilis]
MEQPAFYYLCLLLALLLPLLLVKLLKNHDAAAAAAAGAGVRLPPGPWRLPVIGSLHHLIGKPLVHRALTDLARHLDAPLMYLKLGEVPVVVATSRDAAREVMRGHDVTFATRPWSPTIRIMMEEGLGLAWAPYGDLWRQLRRISVVELLSARRNFELMECVIKQHEERRAEAAAKGTDGQEMEEDLVDVLLRVQKEGALDVPLTMGIIKAVILWAMAELMKHPEVMKKAQAELRGNLNGKPKVTEDDLAHMEDPRYWDDPEEFKPERFECATIDFKGTDFEYIPFGAGRRICPGIMFAQSNIELTLAALLYHFDWELVDGLKPSELEMAEGTGLTVRKKNDLLLHPIIRVPPQSTQ